MENLKCRKCLKNKPRSEFYHRPNGKLDSYLCNDCRKIKSLEWFKKNREKSYKLTRQWNLNNPEKRKASQKKSNLKTRIKNKKTVMNHYSKGSMKCVCCGENILEFLTIDHINNDGIEDRKKTGNGSSFYHWIIKNNFPTGYQVLCFNCNCGRNLTEDKVCPHKKLK